MLERELQNLPNDAGIYKFYDRKGKLLYIGKAKILKNRVKSYFKFTPSLLPANKLSLRIQKMINEAYHLEFIVSPSEYDALILENSLIKELKPKYNILLRDDKTYPYIAIDMDEEFPRFEITRKIEKKKSIKYYGPFSNSANDILKALYLTCKLVQKRGCLKEKKECLFYQIGKCYAPCVGKISKEEYAKIVTEATTLLMERKKLILMLEKKMIEASQNLNFEEAGILRDMQKSIKNSLHVIHLDLAKIENFDLFAIEIIGNVASIMRLFIRDGKVVSSIHNIIKNSNGYEIGEIYKRALIQFYNEKTKLINAQIIVAHEFEECEDIKHLLEQKYSKKITITTPKRGDKLKLINIAKQNAKEYLSQYLNKNSDSLLEEVKELFDLKKTPYRIEIFDNSHISGDSPVGCIVTYEEKFIKANYRIFNLQSRDEYGQMRELLTRRIENFKKDSPPDLWILDGGSTLLKLAQSLLKESDQQIDLLAIAKEKKDAKAMRAKGKANDIIYSLNYDFKLPTSDKRLQLLQKLRDEAHRFAITTHRKKKLTKDMKIDLLHVKGIGKATIKKLISYFGTFENIHRASIDELKIVISEKNSVKLYKFLNK
ncbi:MAG TPA: excinuclease ABC subunit UvrC [Sulfurospirillum arcachonense]|nr:excinuclease ABC subunit UvrC [Sulfurospirillum arcachonense]